MSNHLVLDALDLLVQRGHLSARERTRAEAAAKAEGRGADEILIERGHVARNHLVAALAETTGTPGFDLASDRLRFGDAQLIPESVARARRLLAVGRRNGTLLVGMVDPSDVFALDQIAAVTGLGTEPRVIWEPDLDEAIDRAYSVTVDRINGDTPMGKAPEEAPRGRFVTATPTRTPGLKMSNGQIRAAAPPRSLSLGTTPARGAPGADESTPAGLLRSLCSPPAEEPRLHRLAETARRLCDAEHSALFLLADDQESLEMAVRCGPGAPTMEPVRVPLDEKSLPGYTFLSRCEQCTNCAPSNPRHSAELDQKMGWEARSVLCCLVTWEGRPLGLLQVVNRRGGQLEDQQREILRGLADQAALILVAEGASERTRCALPEMVEALRLMAEAADPGSHSHGDRVGRVAAAMGREMKLSGPEVERVQMAGYVHDLGKTGDVEDHSGRGARLLEAVSVLAPLAPAVRHHHARHDQGGESVPQAGRILAVAEAWVEALDQFGPARRSEATAEVLRGFGTRFHPALRLPFEIAAADPTLGI